MRPWPAALALLLACSVSACGAAAGPSARSSVQPGGARALSAFTAGAGASASAQHDGTDGTRDDHRYRLPTGTIDVPQRGVSWMQGSVLHIDGRSVDTGVRAQGYTVLPHGVLLYRAGSLAFTDTHGGAHRFATGVVGPTGVRRSPDGRYLAFLDRAHGPTDDSGAHVYRLDVLDTHSGRQVLSSVQGLGDPDRSLSTQYAAGAPALLAMGNRAAYVRGVDGVRRVPVDGGATTRPTSVPYRAHGGAAVRTPQVEGGYRVGAASGPRDGTLSPSGRVALADTRHFRFAPFDARTGAGLEISPLEGTNNFALGGWLRNGDFWGFAFQGLNKAIRGTGQMTVCSLSGGDCTAASGRLTSTHAAPLLLPG